MINLLPPQQKEIILAKRKEKFALIAWFFVLFFLACLILVSFSVKFYIEKQADLKQDLLEETENELKKTEIMALQEEISYINLDLVKVNNFYQKNIYLSDILEDISSVIPQGAYLTGLSAAAFVFDGKTSFKIDLNGFAPTRETLFTFKKNLEQKENFQEIYLPPSNWIKSADIDFHTTFNANSY